MLNARLAFDAMLSSSNQVQVLGGHVGGLVIGTQAGIRFLGTVRPGCGRQHMLPGKGSLRLLRRWQAWLRRYPEHRRLR